MDWQTILLGGLSGTLIALAAGKAFRRILFLPLEWIVRKTSTPIDDKLLAEAEKDVGIESPTLSPEEKQP